MIKIDNQWDHGDFVYIRTDPEQRLGQVTHMQILPENVIMYNITIGATNLLCYDFELSETKEGRQTI